MALEDKGMEKHEVISSGELARYIKETSDDDLRREMKEFVREIHRGLENIRESFADHKIIATLADIGFFGAMTYAHDGKPDRLLVAGIGCESAIPADIVAFLRNDTGTEAER